MIIYFKIQSRVCEYRGNMKKCKTQFLLPVWLNWERSSYCVHFVWTEPEFSVNKLLTIQRNFNMANANNSRHWGSGERRVMMRTDQPWILVFYQWKVLTMGPLKDASYPVIALIKCAILYTNSYFILTTLWAGSSA